MIYRIEGDDVTACGLIAFEKIGQIATRDLIYEAEKELSELPQQEMEPRHIFAKGLYSRTICIPAGTVLTGRLHKVENLIVVSKGSISVLTDDGFVAMEAPAIFKCEAGVKRLGVAITDCVWTNVFTTATTDLDELELELYEDDPLGMESKFDFKTGRLK